MSAAFGWIGEIVQWFADWFPHLDICRRTHGGIKFRHGKTVIEIKPGLFWWLPALTDVVMIPVNRQTLDLEPQKLVTKDGRTVIALGCAIYTVRNVMQALVDTDDHDDTIGEVGAVSVARYICGHDFDDIQVAIADGSVEDSLRASCHEELTSYGVNVKKFFLSDFAPAKVFAHVGGSSVVVEE